MVGVYNIVIHKTNVVAIFDNFGLDRPGVTWCQCFLYSAATLPIGHTVLASAKEGKENTPKKGKVSSKSRHRPRDTSLCPRLDPAR